MQLTVGQPGHSRRLPQPAQFVAFVKLWGGRFPEEIPTYLSSPGTRLTCVWIQRNGTEILHPTLGVTEVNKSISHAAGDAPYVSLKKRVEAWTPFITRAPFNQPISQESSASPNLTGDRAAHPVYDH